MRLHVAERPLRRHHGRPGDRREVLHRLRRIVRVEDEEIVESRDDGIDRRNALAEGLLLIALGLRRAFVARRLEGHEHAAVRDRAGPPGPTASRRTVPSRWSRAASRRDCATRTCRSASAAPSCRARRDDRTAPLCWRQFSPFCGRGPPSPIPSTGCSSSLNDSVPSSANTISCTNWPAAFLTTSVSGLRPDLDVELADSPLQRASDFTHAQRRRRIRALGDRRVFWKVVLEAERPQRHADALVARDADIELRGLPGGGNLLRRRCPVRGQHEREQRQADREVSDEAHMRRSVAHVPDRAAYEVIRSARCSPSRRACDRESQ